MGYGHTEQFEKFVDWSVRHCYAEVGGDCYAKL
jgi:hypothetical protein